jgi:cystathionine beta-lyase
LVADCVYGPMRRLCDGVVRRFGAATRYFPAAAGADAVEALISPSTRLIVLESPGSMTFEVQDVPAIAKMAHARGVMTLVDNTWAAGLLFRPLDHGVDICVQALTKYVCGHSDVFMGAATTRSPQAAAQIGAFIRDTGGSVSPDDAFQAVRGLRTLKARLDRHGSSGVDVAQWLSGRSEIERVMHPALPSDPGHQIWRRDFRGACGLFGVVLAPAFAPRLHAFLNQLELFGLGFSWGGFESLVVHAGPHLHRAFARPEEAGSIVRFHVGLEEPADLIKDLERAFDAANAAAT